MHLRMLSYWWDPETETYNGDIDDYPCICRIHGYAGQEDCPECLHEESGDPRPFSRGVEPCSSIPF